jgi:hypothetical protein
MSEPIYINLTPHAIVMNDGTVFPASGQVARLKQRSVKVNHQDTFREPPTLYHIPFLVTAYYDTEIIIEGKADGQLLNVEPAENTYYIVSRMVSDFTKRHNLKYRRQYMAPDTTHIEVVRNERGQVVSVPGFVGVF